MKVFVTTANGKVGQELVKLLDAKGVSYRLGAHTLDKARKAYPKSEIVPFDFKDPKTFGPALDGITTLYLASPADMAPEPEKAFVDAAKKAGVKRVVKLSAMGVENMDAAPLRQVEKHIEASGLEWTHVRPTWFMQNYATSMAGAVKSGTLAEPADQKKTGFVDVRDIAEVVFQALTKDGHAGKAYALTGPELLDRGQVAETLSKELGKPIRYAPLSDAQFRDAMAPHLSRTYLELMSTLYAGVRAGWTEQLSGDVKKVLGREPLTFKQFAKDNRAAWS